MSIFVKYLKISDYADIPENLRDTDNYLQKIFFSISSKEYNIKEKYLFFYKTLKNIFLAERQKIHFINIFCKIQQIYLSLNRFAYIYKYKKSCIIVNYDMELTQITENGKHVFTLFQNKHRYLFMIKDLVKIIINSLTNTCHFFTEPLSCKNPYNNVILNKSTLYNIYFFIPKCPEILHKYFLTNFNISEFKIQYSYLLRDYTLNRYLKNESIEVLQDDVFDMIDEFNHTYRADRRMRIEINNDFPAKELVDIMRPYLKLFLKGKYSLIASVKKQCNNLLECQLVRFQKFNPLFGRKKTSISYKFISNRENFTKFNLDRDLDLETLFNNELNIVFNTDHVIFDNPNNFMESHIL